MKYYLYYIVFLFISCKSKEEVFLTKFYGQWAIDRIDYNNVNYREDLYVNFMVFEKSNIMQIPESIHFEKDMNATWEVISIKDREISINSIDEVFKGIYTVKFIKDADKKLLGIEMKSDSTFIRAFKFFQDYDLNEKNW